MKESDAAEKGVAFEGTVLPAIDGSYRDSLAGAFNTVVYSELLQPQFDPKIKGMSKWRYVLKLTSDKDKHAKVAGARVEVEFIDNDFSSLMQLIEKDN